MSIIHDALKKVQQEKEKSEAAPAKASASSGYIYAQETTPKVQEPVKELTPTRNKAKSLLSLIGSVALIIGALIFLFRQLNTYIPNFSDFENAVKTDFLKLIHKDVQPPPPPVIPLAKIVVQPAKPAATTAPAVKPATTTIAGIKLPAVVNNELPPIPPEPQTLDVHGVMSNGSQNIALINDQVYQEGDTVDGVKIVKISMNSIVVDNNGKAETIPVKN